MSCIPSKIPETIGCHWLLYNLSTTHTPRAQFNPSKGDFALCGYMCEPVWCIVKFSIFYQSLHLYDKDQILIMFDICPSETKRRETCFFQKKQPELVSTKTKHWRHSSKCKLSSIKKHETCILASH